LKQGRANDHPPHLVVNKSGIAKRPEIKIEDFSTALGLTPLVTIPFDAQLFGTAANNGQMIAETDPRSQIAAAFELVARTVLGRSEPRRARKGALAPLLQRFARKKKSA
jgi:pilus assembly protein CpaE